MKKLIVTIAGICCLSSVIYGQGSKDKAQLKVYEDSLKTLSETMINGEEGYDRRHACYLFIRHLVEALQVPGSFEYPFDSLRGVSILYPENRAFRIFNWQLLRVSGSHRYYGAIQINNPKELQLYPLFDNSDFAEFPKDTVLNKDTWYGALYYNMKELKIKGKRYYTLFGWDGHNLSSNRKVIDVLHFDKDNVPLFGAPIFSFATDSREVLQHRFAIEYKKDASVNLNYSEALDQIIFDHLVPENPAGEGRYYTYIPDGTYEGFEFKSGKWVYIEKVFNQKLEDGQFPVPNPVDFDNE